MVERGLVLAVEPELLDVQAVLLDAAGEGDVAVDCHTAQDEVGLGGEDPLDVGRQVGVDRRQLQVGVADVIAGRFELVDRRLAGGGRARHVVGEDGQRRRLRLLQEVGDLREDAVVCLHRPAGAEEVGWPGPVAGDVVAVRRRAGRLEVRRVEEVRRRDHRERVVLVDDGVGERDETARCPAVVEVVGERDLPAVHAAGRVDHVEVRLDALDERGEVGADRPGKGRDGTDVDLLGGHAGRTGAGAAGALERAAGRGRRRPSGGGREARQTDGRDPHGRHDGDQDGSYQGFSNGAGRHAVKGSYQQALEKRRLRLERPSTSPAPKLATWPASWSPDTSRRARSTRCGRPEWRWSSARRTRRGRPASSRRRRRTSTPSSASSPIRSGGRCSRPVRPGTSGSSPTPRSATTTSTSPRPPSSAWPSATRRASSTRRSRTWRSC